MFFFKFCVVYTKLKNYGKKIPRVEFMDTCCNCLATTSRTFCNFLVTKSRLGIVEHMSHSISSIANSLTKPWSRRGCQICIVMHLIGSAIYGQLALMSKLVFKENGLGYLKYFIIFSCSLAASLTL